MASAQIAFELEVPLGAMDVGFADTVLFNPTEGFSDYGYSGPAPLFVQHWFSLKGKQAGPALTYGALRERSVPDELGPVYAALRDQMDTMFIAYDLKESFPDYEAIDYAVSYDEVLAQVMTTPTRSHRAQPTRRSTAPVIVYHHGSQGASDENVAMAEYFSSRGYDFVSANFHWPHADAPYGMEGFANDPRALREVVRYARTLTTSDSVFFIGHSWGAQMGWCALHEPGPVKAFVSLETTIEAKTDTNEIKDKWASVYDALVTREQYIPMPVLLMANTQVDAPFAFFAASCAAGLHVSAKEPFGHESYTSAFLLRHFHRDRFPQPDSVAMAEQVALYAAHLQLIEAFFHALRTGTEFPRERFQEQFFLNRTLGEKER